MTIPLDRRGGKPKSSFGMRNIPDEINGNVADMVLRMVKFCHQRHRILAKIMRKSMKFSVVMDGISVKAA
jgi:hypothetical protein